mgnify:CR=1 FL=1
MRKQHWLMNRYRLMHKITGEVIEVSATEIETAIAMPMWRKEDTYWVRTQSNCPAYPVKRYKAPRFK